MPRPERHLVFDLNDFDETLPGPFEWDVKRLAASVEIAARSQSFRTKEIRAIVVGAVRSYRESMRAFAKMPNQAVWYARLDAEEFMAQAARLVAPPERIRKAEALIATAKTKDSMQAFRKLTHEVDGQPRIISDPPLIVPVEELFPGEVGERCTPRWATCWPPTARSLVSDRKHLFDQYRFVHMARKVVGVGSVGTRAWILLFEGLDGGDPLFLQAKEAQSSVLEQYAGVSEYTNHGERVVAGQRLMQASSDIFLGWQRTNGLDGVDRDYYLRQLRDWKASAEVEGSMPEGMAVYAQVCGWTLARAHARSGDRVAIGAYLGKHTAIRGGDRRLLRRLRRPERQGSRPAARRHRRRTHHRPRGCLIVAVASTEVAGRSGVKVGVVEEWGDGFGGQGFGVEPALCGGAAHLRRRVAWSGCSTPSAVTVMPRACARAMMPATMCRGRSRCR